jgi:hypothetical protein
MLLLLLLSLALQNLDLNENFLRRWGQNPELAVSCTVITLIQMPLSIATVLGGHERGDLFPAGMV